MAGPCAPADSRWVGSLGPQKDMCSGPCGLYLRLHTCKFAHASLLRCRSRPLPHSLHLRQPLQLAQPQPLWDEGDLAP